MEPQALIGLLVFWSALAGLSIMLTVKTERVAVSATLATIFAALLPQIISLVHLGYFEPFYEIAFLFSILMGLPVAFVIAGLTRRYLRRRRDRGT
jgi:hypothetical protein